MSQPQTEIKRELYTVEEVSALIKEGRILSLAGDERALSQLPKGNWIAGTTPYFLAESNGQFNQEKIYVDEIIASETPFKICSYDVNNIENICLDSFENGFTILIIPAFQDIHSYYGLHASSFEKMYLNPIVGWIAGLDLSSTDIPKTYNGLLGEEHIEKAVAIHIELPETKLAQLEILNIFQQNDEGDKIEFLGDGFECENVLINGVETNFADYIAQNNIDIKLPIISNYSGAKINVSFKEVNAEAKQTIFYAPVFKGRTYTFSKPVEDYVQEFKENIPVLEQEVTFACNCILNYLYGELENKNINFYGPITFGEVGYVLLNQTLTYLTVSDR